MQSLNTKQKYRNSIKFRTLKLLKIYNKTNIIMIIGKKKCKYPADILIYVQIYHTFTMEVFQGSYGIVLFASRNVT